MAVRDLKMEDRPSTGLQTIEVAEHNRELTHREDIAKNGDYLGRQPGDSSGRNHFDEEYFVDESENEQGAEMPITQQPAKRH